jgi:hypothetical protein
MSDELGRHIETVARMVWGEPNKRLSRPGELRWGKRGARSVDLEKGAWFDHERGDGGGVLDLVARESGRRGAQAVAWLRERVGVEIGEGRLRFKPHPEGEGDHAEHGGGGYGRRIAKRKATADPLRPFLTSRGSSNPLHHPSGGPPPPPGEVRKVVAHYPYRDADGALLFEVVRYEPKDFRQRRPAPGGGWTWGTKGVRQVPYRLPELIEALAMGRTVFLVEGEKDVEALIAGGVAASCNAGGAGRWPEGLTAHFAGADVVVLADNDEAGRRHGETTAAALQGVAARVRLLDLPPLPTMNGLPAKGDVSDWLAAGGVAADLPGLAERLGRDWRPGAPESRFSALPWSRLDAAPPRGPWLVEDLLYSGDHGLCYGESQSGKSFLAVDLGLAIARGQPFLGLKTRSGAVLYQAGEGGLGLVTRLKAYRRHHGVWGEDLPFVLLPARVDLFDPRGNLEDFLAEVAAWRAWFGSLALVVVDTLAAATPGVNENASEHVSLVLANLERVRTVAGCATLLVHHKNAAGDRPRGHTSLYANADLALEVIRDREAGVRTMRVAKVKDGADGREVGFSLLPVDLGVDEDGKAVTSCVVVAAGEGGEAGRGRAERAPPRRLAAGQALYLRVLDEAILHRGGLLPPGEFVPRNMRGVDREAFRRLYRAVRGPDETSEAVRKARQRDGDALQGAGLIAAHEGWMWITDRGRAWL